MTTALLLGLLLAMPPGAPAKDARAQDARAKDAPPSFLRELAETRGWRSGQPGRATVVPGGAQVIFLRSGPRSGVQSLFSTDVATGATRELLTADSILAGASGELTEAEKARLERQRITTRGITSYQLSRDGKLLVASVGGGLYGVELESRRSRKLAVPAGALDPRLSPDGKLLAFVSGGELHVLDLAAGAVRALTTGATEWKTHGLAEFVAQEEMGRSEGYWWSPDSRRIAFEEADDGEVEKLSIQDPARPERRPVQFAYPRPGRRNTVVRLGIVGVEGGAPTWVEWDRGRLPYLARVAWDEKLPLRILVQDRPQTEEAVLRVDEASGATTPLLVERDAAWLNLDPSALRAMPDGSGFLWFTERNGAAELELRGPDGARRAGVVPPAFGYASLCGVSDDGEVWFVGAPGDPTRDRLWRVRPGAVPVEVPLPGGAPAAMSVRLADRGRSLLVTMTPEGQGSRTFLAGLDGKEKVRLPSVALDPPFRSRPEVRKVGARGLWTSLVRPRDFQPGLRYPVVVQVYGGPTHLAPLALRVGSPRTQWLADQGFLVVKIVNRGETMRLGRDFERAVKGDLAGPALEDQAEGLAALAAEVPELDLARVGITGWSFGGYMAALASLRRPDLYRAAVAGAPVVDWLDYDTHYTERYLGVPPEAGAAYERSSLLTWAGKEHSRLLLVHGTADDNVYLVHSLKLADALFRAGAPATLVPLANVTHLPADPVTTERLAEMEVRLFQEVLGAPRRPSP